ncbi:hypothetical protein OY671_009435, partial [Metschnikowia pulcherrima]
TLPGGKSPDRPDFKGSAPTERMKVWSEAVARAEQSAEEWQQWSDDGCPADVSKPL